MENRLEGLIAEARELENCLKTGYLERAYELAQNIDDELTTIAIEQQKKASHEPPSERETIG